MNFKYTLVALIALLAIDGASAQTAMPNVTYPPPVTATAAQAPAKAPEPDYTLSYNLGLTTDYRYRAISQSRLGPALQGGADYANKNGVYLGTWASTIKWTKDTGTIYGVNTGSNSVEIDLYGGYKGEISKDFSYDLGALQYWYPSNQLASASAAGYGNANTLEVYGALTAGVFTAKYSLSQTNLFGYLNSKGSGYLDLSATFDLGNGLSLVPHLGNQSIKNNNAYAYSDYSLTLNKDMSGTVFSAALIKANTKAVAGNPSSYAAYSPAPDNKNLGKGAIVLSMKKNF